MSTPLRAGGLLFCSGRSRYDPASGELVGATPGAQAGRCLETLRRSVRRAATCIGDAVKLTDLPDSTWRAFAEVNEVYESFFESDPPARVAIGVAALPRGAKVEIDAVVALLTKAPRRRRSPRPRSGARRPPAGPGWCAGRPCSARGTL